MKIWFLTLHWTLLHVCHIGHFCIIERLHFAEARHWHSCIATRSAIVRICCKLCLKSIKSFFYLKNLTNPCLVSTCSILCVVFLCFLSIFIAFSRSDGLTVLINAVTHNLEQMKLFFLPWIIIGHTLVTRWELQWWWGSGTELGLREMSPWPSRGWSGPHSCNKLHCRSGQTQHINQWIRLWQTIASRSRKYFN